MDVDERLFAPSVGTASIPAFKKVTAIPAAYYCPSLTESESLRHTSCCLCFKKFATNQYYILSVKKEQLCIGNTPCTIVEKGNDSVSLENRKVCASCYARNRRQYDQGMVGLGFARIRANSLRAASLQAPVQPESTSETILSSSTSTTIVAESLTLTIPTKILINESSSAMKRLAAELAPGRVSSLESDTTSPALPSDSTVKDSKTLDTTNLLQKVEFLSSVNARLETTVLQLTTRLKQMESEESRNALAAYRLNSGDLVAVEVREYTIQVLFTELPRSSLPKYCLPQRLEPTLYHWNVAKTKLEPPWCNVDMDRLVAIDATARIESRKVVVL